MLYAASGCRRSPAGVLVAAVIVARQDLPDVRGLGLAAGRAGRERARGFTQRRVAGKARVVWDGDRGQLRLSATRSSQHLQNPLGTPTPPHAPRSCGSGRCGGSGARSPTRCSGWDAAAAPGSACGSRARTCPCGWRRQRRRRRWCCRRQQPSGALSPRHPPQRVSPRPRPPLLTWRWWWCRPP